MVRAVYSSTHPFAGQKTHRFKLIDNHGFTRFLNVDYHSDRGWINPRFILKNVKTEAS